MIRLFPDEIQKQTIGFLSELVLPFDGTVQSVGITDTPAEIEMDQIPLRVT